MNTVHVNCDLAGQAIREANHATITPGRLTVPDTCQTVGELVYLARGLDQLCRQLDRNLHQRIENGVLRHDAFGDATDTTVQAAASLRTAARKLAAAAEILGGALNDLSHIADSAALGDDIR